MTHVSEQSTTFNPETLHILGSALDDAWQRLEVRVHLNGSGDAIRTILAKHIIAMAEEGERDRQRLIEGALARLVSPSITSMAPEAIGSAIPTAALRQRLRNRVRGVGG
jgi:hypothetical protein